jgi:hypothetical protein
MSRSFFETVRRHVRDHAGIDMEFLDASKSAGSKSLLAFLNNEAPSRGQVRKKGSLKDYIKSGNGHFSVTALTGLDTWAEPAQDALAKELAGAAAITRDLNKAARRPEGMRLLLFVSPVFRSVQETEGLSVLSWWGVMGPADQEFLFEEFVRESPLHASNEMYWWLKALAFAVGGDDPALIRSLTEAAPVTLLGVKEVLEAHPLAQNKKSLDKNLRHLLFRSLSPDPGRPPQLPQERQLWSQGLLAPSRYSLYHPVMLLQDEALLEKTIAMGQREVFFPLTDQVHAFITFVCEEKIGSLANLFSGLPPKEAEEKYEHILSEISALRWTLINCVRYTTLDFPELQALIDLATHWIKVRHRNAHVRMLPYDTFRHAMSQYESLFQSLIPRGFRV